MKKQIKILFLSSGVLCLTWSFASTPVAYHMPVTENSISTSRPFGGAYLIFAGKFGGEINKKEMEGQRELQVEGCAKGSKIFKYTLEVTKKGHTDYFHAESNVLTSEMQSSLKNLSSGDTFEFSQIKAYMPNGKDIVDVHGKKFVVV